MNTLYFDKHIKIPSKKNDVGAPPPPALSFLSSQREEEFQKFSLGSETLHMTSKGLGDMFKGGFADTSAEKCPLISMGAQICVKRAQTASTCFNSPAALRGKMMYILIILDAMFEI